MIWLLVIYIIVGFMLTVWLFGSLGIGGKNDTFENWCNAVIALPLYAWPLITVVSIIWLPLLLSVWGASLRSYYKSKGS